MNGASGSAAGRTFVSHSINGEDALIRRVFAGRDDGFYVDVGAEHPVVGNDFHSLYAAGWRGINVEPNNEYFELFAEARPRDRNVRAVLSDREGAETTFFVVAHTGLSTIHEDQARRYEEEGRDLERLAVRTTTLAALLEQHDPPAIDVLKVDVEGAEEAVLLGNDWARFRPKLIMVEATLPMSATRRETGIPEFLSGRGYDQVYFDGLNDFYVERTFLPPADVFRATNVFDNVVSEQVVSLRENFEAAQKYVTSLEKEKSDLLVALAARDETMRRMHLLAVDLVSGRFAGPDARPTGPADPASATPPEGGADDQERTPSPLAEMDARLRQERLNVIERENRRLAETVRGLELQNRRLSAGVQELHGERSALRHSLDEARIDFGIVTEARRAIEAVHASAIRVASETNRHVEAVRERERMSLAHPDTARLAAVYGSTSWRLTRPLRAVGLLLKRAMIRA